MYYWFYDDWTCRIFGRFQKMDSVLWSRDTYGIDLFVWFFWEGASMGSEWIDFTRVSLETDEAAS